MNTETTEQTRALAEAGAGATSEQTTAEIAVKVWNLRVEGPNLTRLLANVADDLETARDITVDSPFMRTQAAELAGRFLSVSESVENERMARRKPLNDVLAELQTAYVPTVNQLNAVAKFLKDKIIAWDAIEAKRIRDEQERAAEQRRAEAKKAAEEEAAALAKANDLIAEAAAARAAGSEQVADAMEQEATVVVDTARAQAGNAAAAVYTGALMSAPKASGARDTWKAECTNKADLLKHIGERIAAGDSSLINLVVIDPKAISAMAKIQREHLNIPGLRAYKEGSLSIKKVKVEA